MEPSSLLSSARFRCCRRHCYCNQPQQQKQKRIQQRRRRKQCCCHALALIQISICIITLIELCLPPAVLVTSFSVKNERIFQLNRNNPNRRSGVSSLIQQQPQQLSRLYAKVKTRTSNNKPKNSNNNNLLNKDKYFGYEINDDDDDDDDDDNVSNNDKKVIVPEGEEWSVLDSDRSVVVVTNNVNTSNNNDNINSSRSNNNNYYKGGRSRGVNLRSLITEQAAKAKAATAATRVTIESNNDNILLNIPIDDNEQLISLDCLNDDECEVFNVDETTITNISDMLLDIPIDDDEQLSALDCLNDAECEVFDVDEATVANLSNMLVDIPIDDDEQLTTLNCLNDSECEVFDVDEIKVAEIANMLVNIQIDDEEQLIALDCLNDAECEVFDIDEIKVESITNMLQSERLTPTTKSIDDDGQQKMQIQLQNVDVPKISSSSSSYSDNNGNVAQFLGDRIRTSSSPRELSNDNLLPRPGGASNNKESYYIATRATTVAAGNTRGVDTGATRYLGDRSRLPPPSRDDAGDVTQSGRWLERVMFGTNNNDDVFEDDTQMLLSRLNDNDDDDVDDLSTFDVKEKMITNISDMLLERPPTLRQVISSRGDSGNSGSSYVVPPMISTTAIPSYSDYDPRWRMDDPFESLKVDDKVEERNSLPMLSSVSVMRENNLFDEEVNLIPIIEKDEEDDYEEDYNVSTTNMSNGVVIENERMVEDDLQSIPSLFSSKDIPLASNPSSAPELNFVDGAILATASILETFGAALNVLFPKKPAKPMPEPSLALSEWYKTENNIVDGTLLTTAALFNANVGDITVTGENGVDGTTLATMALFDAITDDMNDDSYSSISIAPEVNEILIGKGEEGPQMLSVEGEIQALTNENAMQMAKIARSKADEEVALVQAEEDIKMKAAEERIALLEKRTRDAEEAIRLDRARLDEVMEEKDRLVAESELTEKKLVDEMNLAVEAVTKDERDRSNMEIEQLRDEYNMSSETKTERIQLLRSSLRTANERRRRLEKERDVAKRNAEMAEIRVDRRYADEMNSLKLSLSERESEIRKMEALVKDNDGIIKDEREKLLAEIMFLTKSFGDLQNELVSNAAMYEDCIETYEREAINKNTRICSLEEELEVANAKIQVLESQIEELDSSLSYEKSINASLMGTVTDLQSVLESTRSYAAGYDNVIAILREEADSYQAMLSATNEDVGSYEMKEKELVELLEKTKDSLDREKARAMDALEDKDTRIATLDKELAEKLNEMNMIRAVAKSTDEQLTTMTGRYDAERDRSDALEEKIRKLNLFRASAFDSGNNSEEGDRLSKLLKDVTASNDEYKVLVSSYENKTKLLSQQLLLSGQNVVNKQRQIENLQRQLVEATANAQTIVVDQEATSDEVSILRTKLDDAISSSTVWKAEANGMISQLTQDLKEKEVLVVELQNRLNNRLDNEVQPQETQLQSDSRSESLENQISQLKDALDESNQKAKERIMNKNQSLKEMQDSVTTLTAEIEDLRREKSQIMNRLNEEVRRREDDYKTREQYLRQKEDRHITEMKMIENDMSQTIRRLEIEIDTLKNKVEVSETSATTRAVIASKEQAKLLEESLRRSKEMEVSLINENMRMKRKIEEMEERKMTERLPVISVVMNDQDDEVNHDRDISVQKKSRQKKIPTYYKEKQRSGVINFVGNAWKKLFRR